MYYIIYKITNLINNKIYIGKHMTNDINDGYMGSGKCIRAAISKYGKENFSKEIISYHSNYEEMNIMESTLVNKEFIEQDNNYNLSLGGYGGWHYVNKNSLNLYGLNGDYEHGGKNLLPASEIMELMKLNGTYNEYRQKLSIIQKNTYKNGKVPGMLGNPHSNETKEKMKKTFKDINHQQGESNSQYGTMWIYNIELQINKKVPKNYVLEDGWYFGRKLKW